ncbi:MAG: MFS transporter [Acidobacteriota bacterium]
MSGTPAAARRGERLAWALYDFANSAFVTLVVTFIYSFWFTKAMVDDPVQGTRLWTRGVAASALLVAVLSPLLGVLADRRATRRRWFVGLTLGAIAGTATLAFVPPPHAMLALAVFVLTNTLYELGQVFYNAFLPGLADNEDVGRVSGNAWALGYLGGLLCLVCGFLFTGLPGTGLEPLLSTDAGWNIRATNLLVAGWFLVFAIPALLLLREPAPPDPNASANLLRALRGLVRFPQALRLLVARLIYNDGLVAAFAFGGIYAGVTFGFDFGEIILFGIWLNVAAGLGAWLFGFVDDRVGGRTTVLWSLAGLFVAALAVAAAPGRPALWAAGTLLGLLVGPNQSASRSLMARFLPRQKTAEFFGLFALSGKITAFLGPWLLGEVTAWTGSQRWAVASVSAFFLVGLVLVLFVDERRGILDADEEERRLAALRAPENAP